MKAILFDGSDAKDNFGGRVSEVLRTQFEAIGWETQPILLREKKIGNCSGDFFCWIRTPGICNLNDDNRELAGAILASDLLVYLTPVTFGGYSSILKRMVDHQIQNISPFFVSIGGETHHEKRYPNYPNFMVVGWMDEQDLKAAAIFRNLIQRNAINFYAKTFISDVILTTQTDSELMGLSRKWIRELIGGQSSFSPGVTVDHLSGKSDAPIHRALLLNGSPRRHKSNSNSIGTYLGEKLNEQSIENKIISLYSSLRSEDKMETLFESIESADLIVLIFPLYVDSLPAPVIEVLERIAALRKGGGIRPQKFASIVNCGFPEFDHNATALGICETFARQSGFVWVGSLALGGGEVIGGLPLIQGGRRTMNIRKSLELAAAALGQGETIPKAAQDLMGKPVIPHWVYRMMGGLGWKKQAKRYGVDESLNYQPYLGKK